MDVPINFKATDAEKDYIPVNYDSKYRGPIQ
jgi:membrane carboxypeptidase/penicillin-binding protein